MDETQQRILSECEQNPKRDYTNQASHFMGATGSRDQERMLAERKNLVQQIEDPLFGDVDASQIFKREKPIHRRMVELSIQGHSNTEIAAATGYIAPSVSKILRQPWARERIVERLKKTVSDEIKELLEAEAIPSLKLLAEVRSDPTARKTDRIAASRELLDRFLGKPTQPISNNAKPPSEMSDDELRAQVQAEIVATQPN